jgi:predicted AAA+ superfamily ATPase
LLRFFHFRTQSGQEVDLVMEDAAGKVVGIEVKASASLGERDYRALRMFSETVGNNFHRGILFYTGREVVPFGAKLFALPVQALWMQGGR